MNRYTGLIVLLVCICVSLLVFTNGPIQANPSVFAPFMQQFLGSAKNNGAAVDFMLRCVREAFVKTEAPFIAMLDNQQQLWQQRYNALLCLDALGTETARNAVQQVQNDTQPQIKAKAQELLREWGRMEMEDVSDEEITTGLPARIISPLELNAEYILIPPGTFKMGGSGKQVTIEQPFYLAQFTVTNKMYREFVKITDYRKPRYWNNKKYNGDDQPVVGVS